LSNCVLNARNVSETAEARGGDVGCGAAVLAGVAGAIVAPLVAGTVVAAGVTVEAALATRDAPEATAVGAAGEAGAVAVATFDSAPAVAAGFVSSPPHAAEIDANPSSPAATPRKNALDSTITPPRKWTRWPESGHLVKVR
jgi:hypothetical protein